MSDPDKRQAGAEIEVSEAAVDEAEQFFWGWMNYNAAGVCEKDDSIDFKSLMVGLYLIAMRHDIRI